MRNHELVPTPLITSIAKLRFGCLSYRLKYDEFDDLIGILGSIVCWAIY